MAPLTRQINDTSKFLLQELPEALRSDSEVILQDAGRGTTAVAPLTLMGKAAVSGKWIVPYNPAAVDGSAVTLGIYVGPEIPGADLVAGDIAGASILQFGAKCDEAKLIIEGATTLETVVGATLEQRRVRDILIKQSLFFMDTEQVMDTY